VAIALSAVVPSRPWHSPPARAGEAPPPSLGGGDLKSRGTKSVSCRFSGKALWPARGLCVTRSLKMRQGVFRGFGHPPAELVVGPPHAAGYPTDRHFPGDPWRSWSIAREMICGANLRTTLIYTGSFVLCDPGNLRARAPRPMGMPPPEAGRCLPEAPTAGRPPSAPHNRAIAHGPDASPDAFWIARSPLRAHRSPPAHPGLPATSGSGMRRAPSRPPRGRLLLD
jgi:hypothetical protein